jgi:hypothetical protein
MRHINAFIEIEIIQVFAKFTYSIIYQIYINLSQSLFKINKRALDLSLVLFFSIFINYINYFF